MTTHCERRRTLPAVKERVKERLSEESVEGHVHVWCSDKRVIPDRETTM